MARSLSAYRCLEITLLVVIIAVVWILMFLPVLIYFLVCIYDVAIELTHCIIKFWNYHKFYNNIIHLQPSSNDPQPSDIDQGQNSTSAVNLVSTRGLIIHALHAVERSKGHFTCGDNKYCYKSIYHRYLVPYYIKYMNLSSFRGSQCTS